MITLSAHYDGKTIVPDEPFSFPLQPGARLTIRIETIDEAPLAMPSPQRFQPLDIRIPPEPSNAIALDPGFSRVPRLPCSQACRCRC